MSRRPVSRPPGTPAGLHRFALFLSVAVVGLIAAGALVKSKEAGLAVPDWPLSYGSLNPPRWWQIETVRAEHGHRLYAGTVALLTAALAAWAWRREARRWVRRLAVGALAAVLVQALLGGVTVLLFLPPPVSVAHAALAQLFLCLVVTVAVATSPAWRRPLGAPDPVLARLAPAAAGVTALVFLQILVGAVMRHAGAGLAIPDVPLAFGRLVPPRFDFAIGVHYAHRVGALLVALSVAALLAATLRAPVGARRRWLLPLAMVGLVALQGTLGALVVLTRRAELPNTLHVAGGAALLALSLTLALGAWRHRREDGGRRALAPTVLRAPRAAAAGGA